MSNQNGKGRGSRKYLFGLFLSKHSEAFNIVLGVVEGLLAERYFSSIPSFSLAGFRDSQIAWLTLAVIVIFAHIYLNSLTRNILKENKERIIERLLESCSDLLFKECDRNKWSVCAMVQVRDGSLRKTPYYVNAGWNDKVDQTQELSFGDVGRAFFSGTTPKSSLAKRLSYEDYTRESPDYKAQVPERLRAIFARPIFSRINEGKVIGVLEFDVLTTTDLKEEFPENLYESIDAFINQNAEGNWTKAISYLLEGI